MSRIRMYNQYFPPYKAAVEAGVGSVMSSFNTVDYIPATANRWLLTDVLRQQWKFDGFVVTDYGAINEMMNHGLGNQQEVAALALKAGTDMDMCSEAFTATLEKSLEEGKVTMADIDQACRRRLADAYSKPNINLGSLPIHIGIATSRDGPLTFIPLSIVRLPGTWLPRLLYY